MLGDYDLARGDEAEGRVPDRLHEWAPGCWIGGIGEGASGVGRADGFAWAAGAEECEDSGFRFMGGHGVLGSDAVIGCWGIEMSRAMLKPWAEACERMEVKRSGGSVGVWERIQRDLWLGLPTRAQL